MTVLRSVLWEHSFEILIERSGASERSIASFEFRYYGKSYCKGTLWSVSVTLHFLAKKVSDLEPVSNFHSNSKPK